MEKLSNNFKLTPPPPIIKIRLIVTEHDYAHILWMKNGQKKAQVALGTRAQVFEKKEKIERFFQQHRTKLPVKSFQELVTITRNL